VVVVRWVDRAVAIDPAKIVVLPVEVDLVVLYRVVTRRSRQIGVLAPRGRDREDENREDGAEQEEERRGWGGKDSAGVHQGMIGRSRRGNELPQDCQQSVILSV